MKYHIPVTWSVWSLMTVEANSLEEAKRKALEEEDLYNGEYIEDSVAVDEEGIIFYNPDLKEV